MIVTMAYNISGDIGLPRGEIDSCLGSPEQELKKIFYKVLFHSGHALKRTIINFTAAELRVSKLNVLNSYEGFEKVSS